MYFSLKTFVIITACLLSGCAAVQYNDGDKVSIQSDGWYGLESSRHRR